ncbi:hypothetical protein [Streptomyces bacillaris]|uniref:hypothetical protein n=1 Tax=Streptomyces bacillaris TaxID=68179 RepID=UPI00363764CE
MDSGWMAVWPVGAFFLGGIASQFTGWLNYRRQRAEKVEDDVAAAEQRREDFELSHLVEFNTLLRHRMNCLYQAELAARRYRQADAAGTVTEEHQVELGASLQLLLEAEAEVEAQIGFVLDGQVRTAAQLATLTTVWAAEAISQGTDTDFAEVRSRMAFVYNVLSQRVRDIYASRTAG